MYEVARKHPSLNMDERYFFTVQIFQMMGIKFRMMCELNIFIKLKIKGFGSLENVGI